MDIALVMVAISDGDFDDDIEVLVQAAVKRRNYLHDVEAGQTYASIEVGDRIMLASTTKPKYLANKVGTVIDKSGGDKIVIELDFPPSNGKYRGKITCPASIIVKMR